MADQFDAARHLLSEREENARFVIAIIGFLCVVCGASMIWGFGGFLLSLGSLLIVTSLHGWRT